LSKENHPSNVQGHLRQKRRKQFGIKTLLLRRWRSLQNDWVRESYAEVWGSGFFVRLALNDAALGAHIAPFQCFAIRRPEFGTRCVSDTRACVPTRVELKDYSRKVACMYPSMLKSFTLSGRN
jgi:hypothetical protein